MRLLLFATLLLSISAYMAYRVLGGGRRRLISQVVSYLSPAPFVALAMFIVLWALAGKFETGDVFFPTAITICCLILFAVLSYFRTVVALQRWIAPNPVFVAYIVARDALLILIASIYSFVALEVLWNDWLMQMQVNYVLIGLTAIAVTLVMLYFAGQRTGILVSVGVLFFTGIGFVQFFVVSYKGAPIIPSDVFAIGTAAAVSGGYDYILPESALWLILACGVVLFLLQFMNPVFSDGRHAVIRECALNSLVSGGMLILAICCFQSINLADTFGLDKAFWQPLPPYKTQGFIPSFLALAQEMNVQIPVGYTEQSAQSIEDRLVEQYDANFSTDETQMQFVEQRPAVVAIMNESYADLGPVLDGLWVDYPGSSFQNSLTDAALMGNLSVSVHGGGTANSEFEFLTGNTMGFLGTACYPYSAFNLANIASLPRQFSDLGYRTIAMHPNLATNWSRDKAYPALGFDEFLDIDDFQGSNLFHSGVSDAATYDKILELLREDPSPQFIFDLTMQNHGGYTLGMTAQGLPYFDFPMTDDGMDAQMNDYLACVEESDRALSDFIAELRTLERPVIVLVFGDHQPAISSVFFDAMHPGVEDISTVERLYTTQYVIWANYDIAGNAQVSEREDLSANMLGARLLEIVGAPLTDYQKAVLALRDRVSAINAIGYRNAEGLWLDLLADDRLSAVNDLEFLQYLNFGSRV